MMMICSQTSIITTKKVSFIFLAILIAKVDIQLVGLYPDRDVLDFNFNKYGEMLIVYEEYVFCKWSSQN